MRAIAHVARGAASAMLWGLVILVGASLIAADETAGQETHRAALLIDFGSGQVESSCVSFSEDEISGADLLRRSGLGVVFSGFGGLGSGVCQIDGEGCSNPGNCFCQCQGATCRYWSYWVLEDGAWRYQPIGASQRDLRHGAVDAWVWGNGRTPPDPATFSDVCPLTLPTEGPRTATARPPSSGPAQQVEPTATPRAGAPAEGGATSQIQPTKEGIEEESTAEVTEQVRGAIATPPMVSGAGEQPTSSAGDDGTDGAPVGLISFGVVAGALVLVIGGLVARGRIVG